MASLTITVPDAIIPTLLEALRWKYPEIDVTNLTAAQQGRRFIAALLKAVYTEYQLYLAMAEATTVFKNTEAAAREAAETTAAGISE